MTMPSDATRPLLRHALPRSDGGQTHALRPQDAGWQEPVGPEGEDAIDYLCLVMPLRLLD